MPEYTATQRAALSWSILEIRDPGRWRDIARDRLSFTNLEWSPLPQLYGSFAAGLSRLSIIPGSAYGLGFAALDALDATDAIKLQAAWMDLLTPARKEACR